MRFIENAPGVHRDGTQQQDLVDCIDFTIHVDDESVSSDSSGSSMPALIDRYHSESSSDDDSSSDSSFIRTVNAADVYTAAVAATTHLFTAQDLLRVDPDDEDFLSDFTELSPDRAMIDQLIMTLGQRSTNIVLNSPDSFFHDDSFIESNRQMNLLIRMVGTTSHRTDQLSIESPDTDVSSDANEVGGTDSDGFHLPPLELIRISRDTTFIDTIDDEMRRMSLLHNLSMTMCAESSPANYVIDTTTRGAHTLKFVEYL